MRMLRNLWIGVAGITVFVLAVTSCQPLPVEPVTEGTSSINDFTPKRYVDTELGIACYHRYGQTLACVAIPDRGPR